MTSSSKCFFLGSLVVSLLLFLGSTSTMALTKDINSTCYRYSVDNSFVHNKTFCLQTLTAYPPAVSATNMVELVKVTLDLGSTQAKERAGFVAGLEKEPTFKKYFEMCSESYAIIVDNFRGARLCMEDGAAGAAGASITILQTYDNTQRVKDTIGKNTDNASKKLMEMTLVMEDFVAIADAAISVIF
ncbi:uncharacterized protein LOC103852555 [Brassica rapa]|nr:uncharacterized protein LOC103852555 [Brassica rapa]